MKYLRSYGIYAGKLNNLKNDVDTQAQLFKIQNSTFIIITAAPESHRSPKPQ